MKEMSTCDRKAAITSYAIHTDVRTGDTIGKVKYTLPTAVRLKLGDEVCQRFFIDVLEINSNYCVNANICSVQSLGRDKSGPKSDAVKIWLKEQEEFHEYMPDTVGAGRTKSIARQTGVQLPYPSRKEVYEQYALDMNARMEQPVPVGLAPPLPPCLVVYFRHIWRTYFPHLHLRKHLRFSKCDTCVELRTKFGRRENHDPVQYVATRKAFSQHINDVKAERTYYHVKREQAARPGSDSLSIIFDGADQGSYGETHSRACCAHHFDMNLILRLCPCVCMCVCVCRFPLFPREGEAIR